MTSALRIEFSKHAETVILERVISRAWVEQTIIRPQFTEADPHDPKITRAYRAIAERQNRVLRVVYRRSEQRIVVITAFFDRARR